MTTGRAPSKVFDSTDTVSPSAARCIDRNDAGMRATPRVVASASLRLLFGDPTR